MNEAKSPPLWQTPMSPGRLWTINICLNNGGNAARSFHSCLHGTI